MSDFLRDQIIEMGIKMVTLRWGVQLPKISGSTLFAYAILSKALVFEILGHLRLSFCALRWSRASIYASDRQHGSLQGYTLDQYGKAHGQYIFFLRSGIVTIVRDKALFSTKNTGTNIFPVSPPKQILWYSLETPCKGMSNEYPEHIVS